MVRDLVEKGVPISKEIRRGKGGLGVRFIVGR